MTFAGKVVFVAGGCGVIGSGIARAFLHEGATVVVNSRSAGRLDDLKKSIPASHQKQIATIQEGCDSESAIRKIKNFILKEFGKVDHVITSLGSVSQSGALTNITLEDYQREIHNGAGTHFLVSRVFLPYLSASEGSSFTYISGSAGEYCFDKKFSSLTLRHAALYGIIEAARAQFKGSNVAINEVRVGILVVAQDDSTLKGKSSPLGNDFFGKAFPPMIKRRPSCLIRISTREEVDNLIQM